MYRNAQNEQCENRDNVCVMYTGGALAYHLTYMLHYRTAQLANNII